MTPSEHTASEHTAPGHTAPEPRPEPKPAPGPEATPAPPPIRLVVADDHHVVRTGFAALLDTQPDFTVAGTARDGAEAVRVCAQVRPDVVLMDVRMPGMDGIEATRRLTAGATHTTDAASGGPAAEGGPKILILTTFDLDEYVYDALRAGASGFLLKDVTAERLFDAVRIVAEGQALLAPTVTRRLIAEFAARRPESGTRDREPEPGRKVPALAALTPRETQVLRLIAEGLSNPEVARRLLITEETVKTHVSRVLMKLGLRDRTQAVVTAYESGLVVPGSRDDRTTS
jgi:DNA-binding NarL/FixJ family response regulator